MQKKERNSSIELLRIIAMLMIVIHHYSVHGGFSMDGTSMSLNKYILSIVQWGEWAVNIFVLIFGYFSVTSKFKPKKVARLYAQVWFYSVMLFAAYTLWNRELHIGLAVRAVMPIIGNAYWFFSKYILLCLLMPFLNFFINGISRKTHLKLIFLLTVVLSALPTFLPDALSYGLKGSILAAFILLYLIGAYMRLYSDCMINRKRTGWIIMVCSVLIMLTFKLICCIHPISLINIDCFSNISVISIGFAIGAFTVFRNIKIGQNKFINAVAKCTFGVYLIHDNEYIRYFLWRYLLKNSTYFTTNKLIPHMLISVLAVFIICTIIDYIRQQTIEKLWIRYGESFVIKCFKSERTEKIKGKFNKWM